MLSLSSRVRKRQSAWLSAVQRRLKVTESTLTSLKGIKMMGMSGLIGKLIQDLRITELALAMNYRKLQVASIVICKKVQLKA